MIVVAGPPHLGKEEWFFNFSHPRDQGVSSQREDGRRASAWGLCCPLSWTLLLHPLPSLMSLFPKAWVLRSTPTTQGPSPNLNPLLCKWIMCCSQPAPARSPPPPNWFNLLMPESWAGLGRQKPTHQWPRLINDRESRSRIGSDFPLPVIWVSERTLSAPPQSSNPILYGEKVEGLTRPIYYSSLPKHWALDRNSQHSDLSTGHSETQRFKERRGEQMISFWGGKRP